MRYTHSHLGIAAATSEVVVRAITVTAIGTTASQRKRQRGAHGVDVGFTE
jgi:hypothetical protein